MAETVLVVDDHSLVLTTLVCTLLHGGFQVLSASSGEEALAIASQPGQPIHLLICDLILPGMQGSELARRISKLHPQMRCLFITGLPDHPRITDDITASLLAKPFLPHVLIRRAREALGIHRVLSVTAAG
jgi:two-component system, cell cycle sensor histidine kinase and response regulator CckA